MCVARAILLTGAPQPETPESAEGVSAGEQVRLCAAATTVLLLVMSSPWKRTNDQHNGLVG